MFSHEHIDIYFCGHSIILLHTYTVNMFTLTVEMVRSVASSMNSDCITSFLVYNIIGGSGAVNILCHSYIVHLLFL